MESRVRLKNAAIAYYIYFLTMNFAKGIGMSSQSPFYNALFMSSLLFLAIKLVYTKYTKQEMITMVVLVCLGMLFVIRAKEKTMLFAVLAVIGTKGIDFKDLMRKTFYVRLASIVIIRLLCEYGFLEDADKTQAPLGKILHSWGYSDPNTLMVNIFIIMALFIYINYERLNIIHCLITIAIAYIGFQQSYSRTGYALFFLLWFIIFCDKITKRVRVRKVSYFILSMMPLIICVLTFTLAMHFKKTNVVLEAINQALTGRLFIMNYYINLYPFTLLGNTYQFWLSHAGGILAIVDNLYVTIYIYSGIVMLVAYVGAMCYMLLKFSKLGYYEEVIIVSVLSIYAFMEEFPLNPVVNPFCILLGTVIFRGYLPREINNGKTGNKEESSDYNQHTVTVQS